jgi:regulatory protein
MAFGALSVKGRALRYLAQREHSRAELERKLARHVEDGEAGLACEQIALALDELAAHGLLNEQRAAESVLSSLGARFGVRRLRQTLKSKGLEAALVASTLLQARDTELERARQVWQRKFGQPPKDAAERARQMRFMMSRGFEAALVHHVVQGLDDASA